MCPPFVPCSWYQVQVRKMWKCGGKDKRCAYPGIHDLWRDRNPQAPAHSERRAFQSRLRLLPQQTQWYWRPSKNHTAEFLGFNRWPWENHVSAFVYIVYKGSGHYSSTAGTHSECNHQCPNLVVLTLTVGFLASCTRMSLSSVLLWTSKFAKQELMLQKYSYNLQTQPWDNISSICGISLWIC